MKQIKTFIFSFTGEVETAKHDKTINDWLKRNQEKIENIEIKSNLAFSMSVEYDYTVIQTTISYDKVAL